MTTQNTDNYQFLHSNFFYIALLTIFLPLLKLYINGPKCTIKPNLKGQVIIITGANTGIGLESAKVLAKQGARIILACRDKKRGEQAE